MRLLQTEFENPHSTEEIAALAAEERRRREADPLRDAKPGDFIPEKGIFMGAWRPPGSEKKYYVFAAEKDLILSKNGLAISSYKEAAKEVGRARNFCGYDGGCFTRAQDIYKALKEGTYSGKWFIPPKPLLVQVARCVEQITSRGNLKKAGLSRSCPDFHWSSTEASEFSYHVVHLTQGVQSVRRNEEFSRCRLCRAEPVPE
jgi:hypothetical protein